MKSLLIFPYAAYCSGQVDRIRKNPHKDQDRIFKEIIKRAKNTLFGRDHGFASIHSYGNFKESVPVRDYEETRSYFELAAKGEKNILWPGNPTYLAKTSGTTSGVKYIPITPESLSNHISSARLALLNYCYTGTHMHLFNGRVMFLSGSPVLSSMGGIPTGRLSGIVNHEVPAWLKGNQLPSYETNCIEDWEEKVEAIVKETASQDLRLISGIPPWVQMYFERLLAYTGKKQIIDVFPNLSLFIYGGVNYEPYRNSIEEIIGKRIQSIELYPASEGFVAFQDTIENQGLLLNTNSGIFYEFIPLKEFGHENAQRLRLEDTELGQEYVLIINSNAGLWGYNIGDTVRFVSQHPYRLVVTGRMKHFISAFGEHVIGKEVEEALNHASASQQIRIREFHVAPQVNPPDGNLPYHEWFVEFDSYPHDLSSFAQQIDQNLCEQNIYYEDLIRGKILNTLVIRQLQPGAFRTLMKKRGKLGGQNKVPRLSNDRSIADDLYKFDLITPVSG
jgi:acyl-CoA synthetase (AMP-forming)/AMP-acid ligase II